MMLEGICSCRGGISHPWILPFVVSTGRGVKVKAQSLTLVPLSLNGRASRFFFFCALALLDDSLSLVRKPQRGGGGGGTVGGGSGCDGYLCLMCVPR